MQQQVDHFLEASSAAVFKSRGYNLTQPLVTIDQDWQMDYNDVVKAYFTGYELKQILEFFLIDDPILPGQYFPRVSGKRFTYDPSKPEFDMVRKIEIGDLQSGYKSIDLSELSGELFSFTCPLYAGLLWVAAPKLTKGALEFTPKKKDGTPIKSRTEALVDPRTSTSPYLLSDHASIESEVAVTDSAQREIKEWQAIMDFFVHLPDKNPESIPVLHVNPFFYTTRLFVY